MGNLVSFTMISFRHNDKLPKQVQFDSTRLELKFDLLLILLCLSLFFFLYLFFSSDFSFFSGHSNMTVMATCCSHLPSAKTITELAAHTRGQVSVCVCVCNKVGNIKRTFNRRLGKSAGKTQQNRAETGIHPSISGTCPSTFVYTYIIQDTLQEITMPWPKYSWEKCEEPKMFLCDVAKKGFGRIPAKNAPKTEVQPILRCISKTIYFLVYIYAYIIYTGKNTKLYF